MQKLNKNKHIFDRRNCLSKEELIAYSKGMLSEKEKHVIESHLLDCELCTDALDGILELSDPSKLNAISSDMIHRMGADKFIVKKNKLRASHLAAAACVALFIVGGIYFTFIRENENIKTNYADVPGKNAQLKPASPGSAPVAESETFNETKQDAEIITDTTPSGITKSQPAEEIKRTDAIDTSVLTGNEINSEHLQSPPVVSDNIGTASSQKVTEQLMVVADKKTAATDAETEMNGFNSRMDTMQALASDYKTISAGESVAMAPEHKIEKSMRANKQANIEPAAAKTAQKNTEKENHLDTLKVLQKLAAKHPGDMNLIYKTGVAYYNANENSKALSCFDRVINSGTENLFEDARWYKTLTFVKMDDKQNARKQLSYIITEKGIYKVKAERLLEQIDGN